MESRPDSFDVVAVVARARAMSVAGAPAEELAWGDRAADRVRSWLDAWQAEVRHEMTMPRPLPPDTTSRPDDHTDPDGANGDAGDDRSADADDDPAGSGADAEGEVPVDEGGSADGGSSGGQPADELPSLGGLPAPESAAEQARKERRAWLLSCLSAFAEALRAGRITTGHVDTLATVADRLPDAVQARLLARGNDLLRDAVGMTVDRFSRAVQRMVCQAYEAEGIDRQAAQRNRAGLRRGVDQGTKMHWYRFELDPDRGVILDGQLQAERNAIFHGGGHSGLRSDQLELLALLNLIGRPDAPTAATPGAPAASAAPGATRSDNRPVGGAPAPTPGSAGSAPCGAGSGPGAPAPAPGTTSSTPGTAGSAGAPLAPSAVAPPHVMPPISRRARRAAAKKLRGLVLIDATTWVHGVHDGTVCENGAGVPLPPDAVRRLLCIAEVTYGLLINGRLVAQVADNDLATPDQRHGLRTMYATCAGPGCTRIFDHCQIHHIIARARHGPTDMALMIPLCQDHHDAIHHGGWQVTIAPSRDLTWTSPGGHVQFCQFVPLADRDRIAGAPTDSEQLHLFERPPPAA